MAVEDCADVVVDLFATAVYRGTSAVGRVRQRSGTTTCDVQCARGSPTRETGWSVASVVDRHMRLIAAVSAIIATGGIAIHVLKDMYVQDQDRTRRSQSRGVSLHPTA